MLQFDLFRRQQTTCLSLLFCLSIFFSGCDASRQVSPSAVSLPALKSDPAEAATNSQQWPGWRGTNTSGVSASSQLPTQFSPNKGLRWSTPVPGEGHSSPVVWDNHVFLTTAEPQGGATRLLLLCYDRETGKQLWQVEAGATRGSTHVKNGFASASAVTDGKRVFASFGSAGFIACDFDGQLLWRADLGDLEHQWGTAASPVLFADLVIQLCDSAANSSLIAFRQATGEEVWRTKRKSDGCWSTPLLVEATSDGGGAPRTELVVNGTGGDGTIIAYDPLTGAELWQVTGATSIVCPTVISAGDLVVSTSGRNGPIIAIRPGGSGDVTESHVIWKLRRGGPYVPTGIAYRNRLYLIADGGVLACYNPGNGERIWQERLKGLVTASLVAGSGQIYVVTESGTIYVIAAADKFQLLATNEFDQTMLATPAISHGELLIRGEHTLYCTKALPGADTPQKAPAASATPAAAKASQAAEPAAIAQSDLPAAPQNSTPTRAATDSWPQWGGTPGRNMVAPAAQDLPASWDMSGGENVRWIAKLGRTSYGNPAIADGRIFVGTNNEQPRDPEVAEDRGVLMCFRAADGEFLWQDSYEKLPTGDAQDWALQGICSSPAVDGNHVYYLNNRAQLVCADVEGFHDGENDGPVVDEKSTAAAAADIVWRYDLIAELGVSPHNMAASNPLIVGDKVFLVTSNGVNEEGEVPAPEAPSFVAIDKQSGKLIWQEGSISGPNHQVRQSKILDGQWSSPAYGEVQTATGLVPQVFFPGGDGWLYALRPDTGALIWKFDTNPADSKWLATGRGDRNYLVATPVFADNRVYVAVGQDPANGGGPGHLYAIDPTGQGDVTATHAVWHRGNKDFGRSISTVAVDNGLLYAAELDGFLRCLDAKTGEELWRHDTLSQVWGSPLVAAGHIYLGDEDGDIVVLAAGREKNVVADNTSNDAVYGTPVAVGRRLYITTRSELVALEAAAATPAP